MGTPASQVQMRALCCPPSLLPQRHGNCGILCGVCDTQMYRHRLILCVLFWSLLLGSARLESRPCSFTQSEGIHFNGTRLHYMHVPRLTTSPLPTTAWLFLVSCHDGNATVNSASPLHEFLGHGPGGEIMQSEGVYIGLADWVLPTFPPMVVKRLLLISGMVMAFPHSGL